MKFVDTKKIKNYLATTIIVFAIGLLVAPEIYRYYLNNYIPKRYSIATASKIVSARGGAEMEYEFYVNRKTYKKYRKYKRDIKVEDRFFCSFNTDIDEWRNIYGSKVYLDYKVPNHIHLAPREGWTLQELQKLVPDFQP